MHGTIMLLMFATPLFAGFANELMPLQIGAPDVAFPRLNMVSYWLYLFGSIIAVSGFFTPGGAAAFGWSAYAPLSNAVTSPGIGGDLWVMGLALSGLRHHPRRGQLHHHDHLHARARHDDVPHADLHLEHPAHQHAGAAGLPGAGGGAAGAGGRPEARRPRLRPRQRRRDAVAAPLLVLRASRGLHHRPAVLRHHHRGPAGLQPQADLRLHRPGRRDDRHRGPVGDGVGPPHVRHRPGAAAVLLVHDVPHRGPDRREVLQLDRHDVAGASQSSRRRCSSRSASWSPSCSVA